MTANSSAPGRWARMMTLPASSKASRRAAANARRSPRFSLAAKFPAVPRKSYAPPSWREVTRPGDAALASRLGLGVGHLQHVPQLAAVGEAAEGARCVRVGIDGSPEVGRHRDHPRLGVELHVHVHVSPAATPARVRFSLLTPTMNTPPMVATVLR